MANRGLRVVPLSGALGAEIEGVDLACPLDGETFAKIREVWLEYRVIFFRDQRLSPEQHQAFARRFGELQSHPYVKSLDGFPHVIPIVKEPADEVNFGGGWHTDVTFLERPALGSLLYAHQVPARGGDTLFADMVRAYETLSEGMRELLAPLRAVHSARSQYGLYGESARNASRRSGMQLQATEAAEETVEHPVVRTHPETGRRSLFVNPAFSERFVGMTRRESRPLLDFLYRHATEEANTCRFHWTAGALAFWDNRCTQHYALNDYPGERREMHRVTVQGERPV
ncbi:MAG: TauD/TfdA dioxygenase family protein [Myxococcota bacterium]